VEEGLTRLNARVFVWILERLPSASKAACAHFFETTGGEAPRPVALAPHDVQPDATYVFTLGSQGALLYVTLTGADPARIGAILARLEAEGAGAGLRAAALPLTDPYMAENGREGVALLPPSGAPFFPEIPDAIQFDREILEPRVVVFLDGAELALAREHGADALAERFRLIGRSLIRFPAPRR
jgi:hypothetical protein